MIFVMVIWLLWKEATNNMDTSVPVHIDYIWTWIFLFAQHHLIIFYKIKSIKTEYLI